MGLRPEERVYVGESGDKTVAKEGIFEIHIKIDKNDLMSAYKSKKISDI